MKILLQKASNYLKQGKFIQAGKICKEILIENPNLPSAMFIQAVSFGNTGQLKKSLNIFNKLHKHHPTNPEVYYNKGIILQQNNLDIQASIAYKEAISLNSKNPFVFNNYANLLYQQQNYKYAIDYYKKALSFDPVNIGFLRNLIKSFYLNKQYNSCLNHINNLSLLTSLESSDYDLQIQSFIGLGRYRKAFSLSKIYLTTDPDNYLFHFLMGLSSLKLNRYPKAIRYFKNSIKRNNNHKTSYMNLALAYSYLADYSNVYECIETLEKTHPNNEEILEFICTLKEMQDALKSDDTHFISIKSKYPNNHTLQLLSAQVLLNSSKYLEALKCLNTITNDKDLFNFHSSAFYKQGHAYDKLNQFDQAWKSYSLACNSAYIKNENDQFNNKLKNAINQLKNLEPIETDDFSHQEKYQLKLIFIVGFPRSGTTLVDSILSCQYNSIVLEEAPLLDDVIEKLMENKSFDNYYQAVSSLSKESITELRDLYINNISLYHNLDNNKTVIDKSPLNLIHSLLIHKLFPKAPIIFAVRHPFDSCISCYMQDFNSNRALNNCFTSPKAIANTYNNLMQIWSLCVSKGQMNYYYQFYEKLVVDTQNQTKKLIEFVDFEWSDVFLSFHKQSKSRGMIHNPSYNQVNKPIHQNKKFRHLNYLPNLSSFGSQLDKWIDFFNYKRLGKKT